MDKHGNINLDELKEKAAEHADNLGALMITYPSTHGVLRTTSSRSPRPCTSTGDRSTWTGPT